MKKDKAFYGWLFVCIVLVILLGISIFLGISGWYFKVDNSLETDIVLGENVQVDIKRNMAQTASLSFPGNYLNGEKLAQNISVKNIDEEKDLFLRAKISVYSNNNSENQIDLIENVNWTRNEDGYFYFNELLQSTAKASLCSFIVIGEESNFDCDKNYIFSVIFESLDSGQDVEGIWGVQPIVNELT